MKFAPFLVILSSLISVSLGDEGTEELKAFFESKLAERDLKIDEMTNTVNEMKIHGHLQRIMLKTMLFVKIQFWFLLLLGRQKNKEKMIIWNSYVQVEVGQDLISDVQD